jgi:hypothetical protein
VSPGGFKLGAASLTSPTLSVAGHTTVAAAVSSCATCHESAPYMGMMASSNAAAGDSRPNSTLDAIHPASGDCGGCHTTTPTFSIDQTGSAKPANHVPTTAPCAQCHTTAGNNALYSVTGTHQGVTGCLSCHGSTVATTFTNITIVTNPGNHFPFGSLDCNGSGCHTTSNVSPGGFKLGAASLTAPTLTVAGHTTVAAAVAACQTCHESAPYLGMIASSVSAWGDSRPQAFDTAHPATGDCNGCHTTTPTFALDMTQSAKPANHIPTAAPCTQCHTTAGNYALYSSAGTHQGVTGCLSCHGSTVAGTFSIAANPVFSIVTTSSNHIPIGSLDCNGSGCHSTSNVSPGGAGFKIGAANISTPTLTIAGHTTVTGGGLACATCHETANFQGMLPSTAAPGADSRPNSYLSTHPATGDCGNCHVTTPTFAANLLPTAPKPANHIPTTAVCAQCHTTIGNFGLYSVIGVHQGVSGCLSCHGSGTGPFAGPPPANTITIVGWPGASHIPIGTLDCSGSGCHTTSNVSPGGFKIGSANISSPTLTVAGHTTVAAAVSGCASCHETAPYLGMIASSATTAGDSRPSSTLDKNHPATGDCNGCHTTTPTFITDQTGSAKPANHIPTTAPCAQCHTTPGNNALYSVTGTHQGVTGCLSCHGSTVATNFANITIVTNPSNHFPFGTLDCNGSGCHTTTKVNPGGFKLGAASLTSPTLNVAGHTTVAAAVGACQTCHQSAPYVGMIASSATAWGDSRPQAYDKAHPATGDCNGCHTTAPTFMTDQTGNSKPANHIPTTAPCAQCHTTPGNNALYSVTATHQGVTGCLSCHGSTVATTFANITIVTNPSNHFPFGSLDCNGSGCHTTTNVNAGGFKLGAASLTAPILSVAGHTTVKAAVPACQTCHESAPYMGMLASSATAWGDSRPQAYDKAHPATGDCNGCHTTTPTFATNQSGSSAKPANHIPTNAPCAQCHTTAGNYAAYVMGSTGHAGITNNCAQCHAYGLSFYNMAAPTLKQPAAGATGHIPGVPPNSTTAIACELCHSPSNFTTFSGTVMKHAYVVSMKCMSCHERGMTWQTNAGTGLWTRPNGHHTGQDCGGSGCHSSRDKLALRPVARPATTASSTAPKSGTTATTPVKPPTHIASSNNCLSCHTTVAWLPVKIVDHTQVIGSCVSCHNGVTATGKPSRHVATSAGCERCHTTNAWTPARFDHTAVAAHTCVTCHNAVQAIGMPRTHIPTTQQCDVCHGTLAWKPAKVDHSTFVSSCAGCHNNVAAVGMPPGHMSTRIDCSTCHSYPDWSVLHFRHVSAPYPGDHRVALSCTSCHSTDTDQIPWRSPANAGSCAGCHAQDFKPAAHPKTLKGQYYTVNELANCSGACHLYSDSTQSTITRSLPGPYHRVWDTRFRR